MFLYSLIVAVLSFSAAAELNEVPTRWTILIQVRC